MDRFGLIKNALLVCGAWLVSAGAAHAAEMDLRVLVVAVGDSTVDPGRAVAEQVLDKLGMPFEVVDSSRTTLTNSILRSGSRGRFNGVILTQSETILPNGTVGFTAAEFALLQQYERDFGVREAVLSGFPATNPSLGLDYGMASIAWGNNVEGRWLAPAGGTELFEHVNIQNALPTEGFTFLAQPRVGGVGPVAEPLLVNDDDTTYGMVFRVTYPDGRRVLLSLVNNATFFLHSSVLVSELVHFATSGIYFGARRVYLSLHNDDMFLADEVWNPQTESNFPEDQYNYRLTAAEVPLIAQAHTAFRAQHPLASQIITELAFNGIGAASNDPLTTALRNAGSSFAYINHTYSALQMDRLCPEDGATGGGSSGGNWWDWLFGGGSSGGSTVNGCTRTDYTTAYNEISRNQGVWRNFNFPGYSDGRSVLLSDSHSGLSDRRGTVDVTTDDIVFPAGFNDNFGRAATALGVRTLAADASRPNQNRIQRVPNHNLVILPRYPTSLFYNTTTPAELVSEYNYIHHYRYIDAGQDPCAIAGAICAPRSYEEILQAEATTTLRHMLAGDPFPHYFHQTNLRVYDTAGHILQLDWMHAVVGAYEQWLKLPIESPRFHQLSDIAWRGIEAREAGITGTYDNVRRTITLRANRSASLEVTGLQGGVLHGGQRIRTVDVIPFFSRTFTVDQALTQ
jgi:hypothetical protein